MVEIVFSNDITVIESNYQDTLSPHKVCQKRSKLEFNGCGKFNTQNYTYYLFFTQMEQSIWFTPAFISISILEIIQFKIY